MVCFSEIVLAEGCAYSLKGQTRSATEYGPSYRMTYDTYEKIFSEISKKFVEKSKVIKIVSNVPDP